MSAPRITVIVPVYNDARNLTACLQAVRAAVPADAELIVVDDASTDDSAAAADAAGARVIRQSRNLGPAAARNRGAAVARGDILVFVDSDVTLAPDAVGRMLETFDRHLDVAAVFGSYDAAPRAQGVVSQYRNLLHHFVHQTGNREAETFWSGCGAVRCTLFLACGGFSEDPLFARSMEDVELGYRLRRAGHRIVLDKHVQGTHLKAWTLAAMIKTDIFYRAIPWSHLILSTQRAPNDLNLQWRQRVSGALVLLALACLAASIVRPALVVPAAVALATVVWLNHRLFRFFIERRGLVFAAAAVPLHLLYYVYSSLTYLFVWVSVRVGRRRLGVVTGA